MLISTNSGLHSARRNAPRIPMAEAMDFFAQAGFEAVDVNFCGSIYREPFRHEPILDGDGWQKNLDEVLSAIRRNHLVISHTHLPFYDFDMKDQDDLAFCNQMMLRSIDATAHIGATLAVIHPHRDPQKRSLIDRTVELLTPLRDYAGERGVTLCLENMFTTRPEELVEMVDRLGCAACWDVGHANYGGFAQYPSMCLVGKRIKVLHLHDNYGVHDDHLPPHFGQIDWDEVMRALRDIGYDGTFNYEVSAGNLPEELRMQNAQYMVAAARRLLGRS